MTLAAGVKPPPPTHTHQLGQAVDGGILSAVTLAAGVKPPHTHTHTHQLGQAVDGGILSAETLAAGVKPPPHTHTHTSWTRRPTAASSLL